VDDASNASVIEGLHTFVGACPPFFMQAANFRSKGGLTPGSDPFRSLLILSDFLTAVKKSLTAF
jgi:hypothetical protein